MECMRAFVLTGPRTFAVQDVPTPEPGAGEVVVDVERVGLCGTDVEFFTGVHNLFLTFVGTPGFGMGNIKTIKFA